MAAIAIFGGVGAATTLFYFVTAALLSMAFPVSATTGSLAAYAVSAALSYCGHKHLSFTSAGTHAIEAPRFVATTATGLLLAYLLPLAAERIGWPRLAAYAAVYIVVPAINFVLLWSWVFPSQAQSTDAIPAFSVGTRWPLPDGLASLKRDIQRRRAR